MFKISTLLLIVVIATVLVNSQNYQFYIIFSNQVWFLIMQVSYHCANGAPASSESLETSMENSVVDILPAEGAHRVRREVHVQKGGNKPESHKGGRKG